jgi:hypothetical protein
MHQEAKFYKKNGYLIKPWAKTPTLARLDALCRDIFEGRIKPGYKQWVHYDGEGIDVVMDHNYDPVLIDILIENGVPELLEEVVGPQPVLFHVNAVTSVPPGYMAHWHSDGYIWPIHKMFYYPTFDGASDPCLEVVPGHIKPRWVSTSRILSNKYALRMETALSKREMIKSSNDNFLLLHTEVTHRAMPVTKPSGVFRLMFSFMNWFNNEEERERVTSFPSTYIRINPPLVEHYQSRIAALKASHPDGVLRRS